MRKLCHSTLTIKLVRTTLPRCPTSPKNQLLKIISNRLFIRNCCIDCGFFSVIEFFCKGFDFFTHCVRRAHMTTGSQTVTMKRFMSIKDKLTTITAIVFCTSSTAHAHGGRAGHIDEGPSPGTWITIVMVVSWLIIALGVVFFVLRLIRGGKSKKRILDNQRPHRDWALARSWVTHLVRYVRLTSSRQWSFLSAIYNLFSFP